MVAKPGADSGETVLLSTSKNFIFIHVPKTAGSSVHQVLAPYSVDKQRTLLRSFLRRVPILEHPENAHFRIHETAASVRQKLSAKVFDGFTSFAFVRDPFDHAVSHYHYLAQYRNKRLSERFAKMTFEDYLLYRAAPRRPGDRLFVRLPDQSYFLCDNKGDVLVSNVLKYETLNEDFTRMLARLDISAAPLEKTNTAKRRDTSIPLSEFYSQRTIELVQRIYARDFKAFGYSSEL